MSQRFFHHRATPNRTLIAAAVLLACGGTQAFEFDTGNPDLKIRWDNTVKYSAGFRVKDRSPALASTVFGPVPGGIVGGNNINQDDGNNNFDKGLVSNRLDVFSEMDLAWGRWGARVSGAAWYDAVYNRGNNNTTLTANHAPANEFAPETRQMMGRKAEVLDAFVYGSFDLGSRPASVRLGRHTLLWGESLFFGANGISGGQAPVDVIKLLSVPNSTFKEIARPTGKLSGQVQVTEALSLSGYLGYEWQPTRLMPVGAFLSASDSLGPGAERINAGPTGTFNARPNLEPKDTGQGGLQLRWRADEIDADIGFYATRYHALAPSNAYTTLNGVPPALSASTYRWAFHEGIRAYGVSMAKTVGAWSLAGEMSVRHNTPLASSGMAIIPAIGVGTTVNNNTDPGYAVGKTAHAQFSWLASLGPNFLSRESSFLGEIAWNTRTSVDRNAGMLNPLADKSARAIRMVYSPTYRQALPGLDLTPSMGVGYARGRSSAVGPAFGVNKGGDFNIGLAGTYLGRWVAAVNYVHFFGPEGGTTNNASLAQYKQSLRDRDFVSLSLRTTF